MANTHNPSIPVEEVKVEKPTSALLEVIVKKVEFEKDGKKTSFLAYTTFDKYKNKLTLKFTQAVKNTPTENCFIVVSRDKMNISNKKKYPVLWVREIMEIKPLDFNTTEDDLPF